jgi:hypothetical protein
MEKRTRRGSDALQRVWAALCQIDAENGREQGFLPGRLEPTAKESRHSVSSPIDDICSVQRDIKESQLDKIFSDLPRYRTNLNIDVTSLTRG